MKRVSGGVWGIVVAAFTPLPLITPKGYCVWPSWILVYMCFKINIDFLPFAFATKWGEQLIND